MSTREQRQELARCASPPPPTLPPSLGKPVPLSRLVEPFCRLLYDTVQQFRDWAASINSESSPNGRTCFDDGDMAKMVIAKAQEDGGDSRITGEKPGVVSTAVKRCMSRCGMGRATRIREAKQALLGSAQPAE